MSPQLLWTIVGLLVTVLTLAGVGVTAFQSTDGAKNKLVVAEVEAIASAAKIWIITKSTNGIVYPEDLASQFPTLVLSGTGASSMLISNFDSNLRYALKPTGVGNGFELTFSYAGSDAAAIRRGRAQVLVDSLPDRACKAAMRPLTAPAGFYACKLL